MRMHMSYADAMNEPYEAVQRMLLIWSLDDMRENIEAAKRKAAS